MPFFSVIIPIFNRADLIRDTLDSVFAQSFQDFEIIVINDGSTDDTPGVLAGFKSRIHVIHQANRGQGPARNNGIQAARGKYLAFLDSDDLWFPWTLETFKAAIDSQDGPSLVIGSPLMFHSKEEVEHCARAPFGARHSPDFLAAASRHVVWIGAGFSVVRATALADGDAFPDHRINSEDFDYLLRLGTAPGFVEIDSPPTFAYRQHAISSTRNLRSTYDGLRHLLNRELEGAFPGGPERRRERLEVIGRMTRNWTAQFAEQGHFRLAWLMYLRGFAMQFQLRRFRYLLGFPFLAPLYRWRWLRLR